MIQLYINRQLVAIPSDFSPTIQYDNAYFTKSSSFSLDVTLPLMGCVQNVRIFGNIHRFDVSKQKISYPCEMIANGRVVFRGIAAITKVTDVAVTVQLLGGNSIANFFSDDVMIDKMELGIFQTKGIGGGSLGELICDDYRLIAGSHTECDMVIMPTSDHQPSAETTDETTNRKPSRTCYYEYGLNGVIYVGDISRYPVQPYLLKTIRRVIESRGYRLTRFDAEGTWMDNIYITNYSRKRNTTLFNQDQRWTAYVTDALPHWSFNTFLTEIEKFLGAVVMFQDNEVQIVALENFYTEETNTIYISDANIIDEYEVNVNERNSEKNDITTGNLGYDKTYSNKYLKLDNELLNSLDRHTYANYDELSSAYAKTSQSARSMLYMIDNETKREYISCNGAITEVNQFGDLLRDNTTTDTAVKMMIVPANTESFDGQVFQNTGGRDRGDAVMSFAFNLPFSPSSNNNINRNDSIQLMIENSVQIDNGEDSNAVIEVAINTGHAYTVGSYNNVNQSYPVPFTDYKMLPQLVESFPEMSLSLHDVCNNCIGHRLATMKRMNTDITHVFRIASAKPYDVTSIFVIHNQRYACKYIKTDYNCTDDIFIYEGEFYKIL